MTIAAPEAVTVVAGEAGIVTLFVEGPTVRTPVPELNDTEGVIWVLTVPVVRTPVAALNCGAGILMFRLFVPNVPLPAAPTVLLTEILVG